MQCTAVAQQCDEQFNDIGADETAVALAMLRPWVWEEDPNARQGSQWDASREVDEVTFHNPHVAQTAHLDRR